MQTKNQLAILFADIAGSTRLYEELGNDKARLITSRCLDRVSRTVSEYNGTVIKTIGDEVMCVFPAADIAARAAIMIQNTISAFSPLPGISLQMRIGFHFGEVLNEKGDVFGNAVNIAARMTAQAKAEQIITTGETLNRLSPQLRSAGRQLNEAHIHGKNEPIQICELTWGEVSELTVTGTASSVSPYSAGNTILSLSFQGYKTTISRDNPLVTMGRGDNNSLVIQDLMASRRHARAEWRISGDFYLVDQSTNGVYVLNENGEKRFLHRGEMQLTGSGTFGLGRELSPASPEAIHYRLQE